LTLGCTRQSPVPVVQEQAKFIAQSEQFLDASIQSFESLANEGPDTQARGTASVPGTKDALQVCERKPYDEGPLNEQHAFYAGSRVSPIPGGCSRDPMK
jgi:hypothetical protein